ncbi:hypothetical protein GCM10022286_20910 [Gryllotalpicola daejeonensis]|uniref:PKD domain-containing protein n=2 Tax=Gryllotalpicola daejeonensis TaxID=993087 RepID=A0ABP7ZLJ0_9MICO
MPGAAAAALVALALAVSAATPAQAAQGAPAAPGSAPTSTPAPTGAAAGAVAGTCPDYEFIGARGSGEDNSIPSKKRYTSANPSWGMGGELADLYRRINQTAAANYTTITPYGVPYPAVGIDVVTGDALVSGDLSVYSKSVELGAHAAAAELDRVSRDCPRTGVIMAGYSQGAQAIVEAVLSATPNARRALLAAVFLGNTYFNSRDTNDDYGSFAPGLDGYLVGNSHGVTDATQAAASTTSGDADWASKFGQAAIFDYCHDGDPICGLVDERTVDGTSYPVRDFAHIVSATASPSGDPNILSQHGTYQRGDTANAAQQLRNVLGLPLQPAPKATAKITGPQTAAVGDETRFNAGGSLSDPADPIERYSWTIDAGTPTAHRLSTETPILSTVFATPGSHTIALRTTTMTGAHASAAAEVTVTAAPTAAPEAPTKVTAFGGDRAVSLSWPAVAGAEFYAVRDDSGKLLAAFTPLVPGQQTVSWTDTGLTNGHSRSYRVYAVNSMGRSTGSATVTAKPQAAADRTAFTTIALPSPKATPVDAELAWSLGLGLIVVVLALSLIRTRPSTPRRRVRLRRR